jgi:hypothetical protein
MQDDLMARLEAEVRHAGGQVEGRRQETQRRFDQSDRGLKHVAYLAADLSLKYVIPKLEILSANFSHSKRPRRKGLRDIIFVEFERTKVFPFEARVSVEMRPQCSAGKLRIAFTGVMNPPLREFERKAWLYLEVEDPDTKYLETFLDARIIQFVKDYLRARDVSDDPLLFGRPQNREWRPWLRRCRGPRPGKSGLLR